MILLLLLGLDNLLLSLGSGRCMEGWGATHGRAGDRGVYLNLQYLQLIRLAS